MSFGSLSNELILLIIDNLVSTWVPDSKLYVGRALDEVKNLARCSRSLYTLTQPALYHSLIERENHTNDSFYWLRMIFRRPERASYVKRLVVSCPLYYKTPQSLAPFTKDPQKCQELIASTNVFSGIARDLVRHIRYAKPGAVIALLLACLPNLEEVNFLSYNYDINLEEDGTEVADEDEESLHFIEHVFKTALVAQIHGDQGPMPLKCLAHVSIANTPNRHTTPSPMLSLDSLPVFLLPSVTRAAFGEVQAVLNYSPRHAGDGSGIQHLCLSGMIPAGVLVQFLENFRNIRTLEFTHTATTANLWDPYEGVMDTFTCRFLPQDVKAAISRLKKTLETLVIRNEYSAVGPINRTTLGSLVEFERLKSISTNWLNLVPKNWRGEGIPGLLQVLPPSIETLELNITEKDTEWLYHLWGLSKKTDMPLLRSVHVIMKGDYREDGCYNDLSIEKDDREFVRDKLRECGISFTYHDEYTGATM